MTHSQEIKKPKNAQEGISNFVQMIINQIEAGNTREALLLAVDLRQDLDDEMYKVSSIVDSWADWQARFGTMEAADIRDRKTLEHCPDSPNDRAVISVRNESIVHILTVDEPIENRHDAELIQVAPSVISWLIEIVQRLDSQDNLFKQSGINANELIQQMENKYDPSDADKSQQVAYSAIKLMVQAQGVANAQNNEALQKAINDMGKELELLPYCNE